MAAIQDRIEGQQTIMSAELFAVDQKMATARQLADEFEHRTHDELGFQLPQDGTPTQILSVHQSTCDCSSL